MDFMSNVGAVVRLGKKLVAGKPLIYCVLIPLCCVAGVFTIQSVLATSAEFIEKTNANKLRLELARGLITMDYEAKGDLKKSD